MKPSLPSVVRMLVVVAAFGAAGTAVMASPPGAEPADNPRGPVPAAAAANPDSAAANPAASDDDVTLNPAQPDFTLIGLPTALRLPQFKSAFRVTHRFLRPLDQGSFSSLASDAFGLDTGAQIGLEYRFGLVPGGEVVVHRTSDRTIAFLGQYDLVRQDRALPVDLTVLASVDGTNNFQDRHSPALGMILSRTLSERGALYVEPIWVHNSNLLVTTTAPQDNTFMIGLGGRARVRPSVYLVAELTPRVAGYRPGVNQGGVGIEKRLGGHVFQLNVSNGFGTTLGEIARGGPAAKNRFLGFNISRKFF